jgi:hypothetical protein
VTVGREAVPDLLIFLVVAGGRFELYSAYSIRVPAVPASVFATR